MAAVFVTTCAALAVVMLAFFGSTRLLRRVMSRTPAPRLDDQRLARIEQAVEAIAIEVERISESQRFISKLLGERSQEPSRLPR
ncbi:MAG: hypothetical protein ACHQQR_01470 [Gemmatimonadales bacterium]